MKEIWKDIKDYEGLYQVSNLGRIKSLERKKNKGKGYYYRPETIKKQSIIKQKKGRGKTSYYIVKLSKKSVLKPYLVHRLVAGAFIPNLEEKEYVNHKNGNSLDNNVNNLEWISNRENQLYSLYILETTKNNYPVIVYDKKTKKEIYKFKSMSLASRWLLENNKTKDKTCVSGIVKCCKHKIPSYLGYVWRYESEVLNQCKN